MAEGDPQQVEAQTVVEQTVEEESYEEVDEYVEEVEEIYDEEEEVEVEDTAPHGSPKSPSATAKTNSDGYADVSMEEEAATKTDTPARPEAISPTPEPPIAASDEPEAQGTPEPAPPAAPAPVEPVESFEAAAHKVTDLVGEAAKDLQKKLTGGFASALGGFGGFGSTSQPAAQPTPREPATSDAAPAAESNAGAWGQFAKASQGFGTWLNSLDASISESTSSQHPSDETAAKAAAGSSLNSELQTLFELPDHENLVEDFKCKLQQTYSCSHNTFTPAIQMAFQGTLYITDRHICFTVEERGRKLPFKMQHGDVSKAVRQRPGRKNENRDILRIDFRSEDWIVLKDFATGAALDSALALIEHLSSDARD